MQNITLEHPVLWYEGMPLLPHHFQQEFAYYQNQFHAQVQLLGAFNYGIIDIEVDTLALLKNVFKINRVFAMMPDGTIVKIDNNQFYQLEYNLPKPDEFEKHSLIMYLALPKLVSDNYLIGKNPRYKKESYTEINDFHSGQDPVEVVKMLPNVSLLSGLDVNSNYTTIKIANLAIDKNIWGLGDYIPATMKVNNLNGIYTICSEICYAIRRKINHISELIHARSSNSDTNYISENLLYAQGLGAGLPALEGLLYTDRAHPYQLYLAVCNILGGLGLMTNKFAPPSPNNYHHEELQDTFLKLKSTIDDIINSVIDEKFSQIYFEKEDNIFSVKVSKDYLFDKHYMIGFKKRAACSEGDFLAWVKNSIICNFKQVDQNLQNRTLGCHRERLERTQDILPTRGVYLYKVQKESSMEDIEKMAILNLDDTVNFPEEIFLFVIKEQRK